MNCCEPYSSDGIGLEDPSLKLGDFGEGAVHRLFDCTDLGGDFVGGIFNDLLAHGCSLPGSGVLRV